MNTLSISRRGFFQLAAPVAAAVGLPLAVSAAAPATVPASAVPAAHCWVPAGCTGTWFGMDGVHEGALHLMFEDGAIREATNAELVGFLMEAPGNIPMVHPDRLRQTFIGGDGELFALFAELHRARQERWTWTPTGGGAENPAARQQVAEALEGIASLQATTQAGADLQLGLVQESAHGCAALSDDQVRRLILSARVVLGQPARERRAVREGRAND